MTPLLTPADEGAGEGPRQGRPRSPELERWAAAQPPTAGTKSLIREGVRQLGVSASTVKRALRRRRGGGA
ncbi:hypothetical protein F4553_005380 [Allocatelliglobosispora scoriae]|uniref:Uncharacterized protein n=1 Tax=Allocatelliglobosispora scoriae TaxID=643052 RepID=A0A841BZA7_9ACTN|nr:hypothetical protein [Allocatelliglobosispora scoriae]MBB5872001.1 hypothetical protein [Allocatelliglobosispora scoriae]